MKKLISNLIVLLFISYNLAAGWARTYGGTDHDWGYAAQQTTDGGFIVTGSTKSFGSGSADLYLIKLNRNGDPQWTKTFGGCSWDEGKSLQQTDDGGYIITGFTHCIGNSDDVYLIKTDSNGDTLWTNTFGGTSDDIGCSVQQTTDEGYIISGYTWSYGAGGFDVYIIKTDSIGDSLWTKTFGDIYDDWGHSVLQANDGGYIIAGGAQISGMCSDVYLIKINNSGDSLWAHTIGGNHHDYGHSIQQTDDGGYIITGHTLSYGDAAAKVYLIKTDENGVAIWKKFYGGGAEDVGHSVQQTSDGGYIIAGNTCYSAAGHYDIYLIKTDSDGVVLWTKTFGGAGGDEGYTVQQTTDGGYIIAGYTSSYGAGSYDVWLIKTDENGVVVEETITSIPDNFYYNIKQTLDYNISLEFLLPQNSNVELNIYDVSGRHYSNPISGYYLTGNHDLNFYMGNNGVYFYSLKIGQVSYPGKFIVF
ncbi:MAG: hypothetical protein APR63_13730 [Desulfuromonas sp. SDB]|nr:MAG: hypothetical protein APR63_13730 [Desulfuromonas sp. SDB]